MKKFYDLISLFSILMLFSIIINAWLGLGADLTGISYDIIFKYAIIIVIAMLTFEGIQYLPLRNPFLIYLITATVITFESVFLECLIWNWLELSIINICVLSAWVFIICGIITIIFIQKNIATAKLINQRLEKWNISEDREENS